MIQMPFSTKRKIYFPFFYFTKKELPREIIGTFDIRICISIELGTPVNELLFHDDISLGKLLLATTCLK